MNCFCGDLVIIDLLFCGFRGMELDGRDIKVD